MSVCAEGEFEMRINGGSMSKFRMLLFAVIGILATSMTVFAQGGAEAG
jgi:hypothetical protein